MQTQQSILGMMNVNSDHGEMFTTEFPDIQICIESSTRRTCAHTQNHSNMELHLQLEKYQYTQQEGVGKHNICSTEKKIAKGKNNFTV